MLTENRPDVAVARYLQHERGDHVARLGAAELAILSSYEKLVSGQVEPAIEDRSPRDQERAQRLAI
jgi:hypothetical protein